MRLSRRTLLKGAGALPLAAGSFGLSALAQTAPAAPARREIPPILFVHGNGDHAALWMTTLWRMESNGVPRDRMLAINFTDPLARTDDTGRAAEPVLDRGPAPRTRRRDQGIEAPHRRVARRSGRQFARRLSDPQLHQEWRRRRCQPRRAVRRSQSRRL